MVQSMRCKEGVGEEMRAGGARASVSLSSESVRCRVMRAGHGESYIVVA